MSNLNISKEQAVKMQRGLAEKHKYKPLPPDLAREAIQTFKDSLPAFLKLDGSDDILKSQNGTDICRGYNRIVFGEYGAHIEFSSEQGNVNNFRVKKGQEYRINNPKYRGKVKYTWWTTNDGSDIKIYKQEKPEQYADYIPGLFYVSVFDVVKGDAEITDNIKYYSNKEIQEARKADLIDLLERLGVPLKKYSGSDYIHADHDSLKISRQKGWFWNSRDVGGNSIDYLMKGPDFSHDFRAAVEIIRRVTGLDSGELNIKQKAETVMAPLNNKPDFYMPKKHETNRRAVAYLCKTRKIDYLLVQKLIKEGKIYESNEYLSGSKIKNSKFYNVVFVGYDYEGVAKYAFQRGTAKTGKFACDTTGSDKRYGFRIDGDTSIVHVFESPIDVLSFMSMQMLDGKDVKDTYISCGSVSTLGLDAYLKSSKAGNITEIHVRSDNDDAGRKFANKIKDGYSENYKVCLRQPRYKDYNEDLIKSTELKLVQFER